MSKDEYQFALEHKSLYDFAIVHNNEITILKCPFCKNDGKEALTAQVDTYRITLNIKSFT